MLNCLLTLLSLSLLELLTKCFKAGALFRDAAFLGFFAFPNLLGLTFLALKTGLSVPRALAVFLFYVLSMDFREGILYPNCKA
jgi:hypothetical protein